MTKSCDWCEKEIRVGTAVAGSNDGLANGLCGSCAEKLMVPSLSKLVDYLESLEVPIFVANGDSRFIAANKMARSVAGGDPAEIEGWLIADVFSCVWADASGGCGKAECCRACLIKNALTETIASGRAIMRKPSHLDTMTVEGVQRQYYVISTLKAGDAVLLRMDRIQGTIAP